ncbi:MAG: BACON domain-containing protein [Bacteroidales bacterium]|jgi:hypothetical protein|nr:BACON domain-containing protein [Bacteroidales bacterium]
MKKQFIKFSAATLMAAVMALVVSCKDDDDPALSVTPSATAIVFAADGASATSAGAAITPTFTVETNQGLWDVTSNQTWVKVNKSGKTFTLSAGSAGTTAPDPATVTVTAGGAKPVTITVTQLVSASIPVSSISVSPASLKLSEGDSEFLLATLLPENHTDQEANNTLVWESSDENVVTVTGGIVNVEGAGNAVITVSLQRDPSIKTEVPVVVGTGVYLSQFTTVSIGNEDYLKGEISFTKDALVFINGIDESKIPNAYNRDFFTYDPETGDLTFIGETGTWEVWYMQRLNYFYILRMADEVPVAWWFAGQGFCAAIEWDFTGSGWEDNHPRDLGYMRPIGDGKYQVSGWLRAGFSLALRLGAAVYPLNPISDITGDIEGMNLYQDLPATNTHFQGMGEGFIQGYYLITYDSDTMTLNFERL